MVEDSFLFIAWAPEAVQDIVMIRTFCYWFIMLFKWKTAA